MSFKICEDTKIQIICTTHSPYMLSQIHPESNVLLDRKVSYGKPKETLVVDTSGENWMKPFAQQLGIVPPEFESWKGIITSSSRRVVLVEGEIDLEYFSLFKDNYPALYKVPSDVAVQAYGGKDCLKNTPLLKFALDRYDKFVITLDLDALAAVEKSLAAMGYTKGLHYLAIGKDKPGAQCIEGLVPARIKKDVFSENVELVEALQSADASERKSAKNKLKRKLLDKMTASKPLEAELGEFKRLFSEIAKQFPVT